MLVRKLSKTRTLVGILRSVEVQPAADSAVIPKDPEEIITPVRNSEVEKREFE